MQLTRNALLAAADRADEWPKDRAAYWGKTKAGRWTTNPGWVREYG